MLKVLVCVVCAVGVGASSGALGAAEAADASTNLLGDGGFEHPRLVEWETNWDRRFRPVRPGAEGKGQCLEAAFPVAVWRFAEQTVALPAGAAKVRASCQARLEDVVVVPPENEKPPAPPPPGQPPRPETRGAKLFVVFLDEFGTRLEGWPGVVIGQGTRDWQRCEGTLDVPPPARFVRFCAGLEFARGTAWFDDCCLTALDAGGKPLPRPTASRTDTAGWFAFDPPPFRPDQPCVFDESPLTDAPAGKHGTLGVRAGRLAFADGSPARFWGVNLVADGCFPDRATAERLAVLLSRFGCNMVRLAFMDAPKAWWGRSILADGQDTRSLDAENLDRVEYLIAQLKRRGIYVHVELLSRREFRRGDGVRDHEQLYGKIGLTPALYFDPRLIELQKEFASKLLTHTNPHTGLRWADDPAVAMVTAMNECSLLRLAHPMAVDAKLAPSYVRDLTARWNAWLRSKYVGRDALASAWGSQLRTEEDPARESVVFSESVESVGLEDRSGRRLEDSLTFLADMEAGYWREMSGHLRGLGIRVPLCPSSHAGVTAGRQADFVDYHAYWDHPQGGYGADCLFHNRSLLSREGQGFLAQTAWRQVRGKPLAITEWDFCWPNQQRWEGPPVLAALAAAQGIDCLLNWQLGCAGGKAGTYELGWGRQIRQAFRLRAQPTVLCQFPLAHFLMVRGDVAELGNVYAAPRTLQQAAGHGAPEGLPADLFARARIGVDVSPSASPASRPAPRDLAAFAPPNHLRFSENLLVIDSPRTQGLVGLAGKAGRTQLADLSLTVRTPAASVAVSSLDGLDLARSRRMLITACAAAENTGMAYNPVRRRLLEVGQGPILIQPVAADLSLRGRQGFWKLTPLDPNAVRVSSSARTVTARAGSTMDFSIGADRCLWYVLEAQSGN